MTDTLTLVLLIILICSNILLAVLSIVRWYFDDKMLNVQNDIDKEIALLRERSDILIRLALDRADTGGLLVTQNPVDLDATQKYPAWSPYRQQSQSMPTQRQTQP